MMIGASEKDNFSNYFDDGKEWWGIALWSIYDKWMNRFVVIRNPAEAEKAKSNIDASISRGKIQHPIIERNNNHL